MTGLKQLLNKRLELNFMQIAAFRDGAGNAVQMILQSVLPGKGNPSKMGRKNSRRAALRF
ncbi:hypothetical protein D6851_01030 [Altericroceibacterium spongiae]|uniref:Uncharacterized protein n=1 Tax=Altericroceibacterium spongiae TaxID=2320269 RepID=A0A420ER23_9SPHN|nr:hypothetical protein D6851_01030 [Altericroceibacterium spongiae]